MLIVWLKMVGGSGNGKKQVGWGAAIRMERDEDGGRLCFWSGHLWGWGGDGEGMPRVIVQGPDFGGEIYSPILDLLLLRYV